MSNLILNKKLEIPSHYILVKNYIKDKLAEKKY